jgi:hypothetical protein
MLKGILMATFVLVASECIGFAQTPRPPIADFQAREDCLFDTLKKSDKERAPSTIAEVTDLAWGATELCSASLWSKMSRQDQENDRWRTRSHAVYIEQQFKIERQILNKP